MKLTNRYVSLIFNVTLACVFCGGCQKKVVATVSVNGIEPSITKLRVYAWLDKKIAQQGAQEVTGELSDFALRFPIAADAKKLDLVALGIDGNANLWSQGYSSANLQLANNQQNLNIQMTEAKCGSLLFCGKDSESTSVHFSAVWAFDSNTAWMVGPGTVQRCLDSYCFRLGIDVSAELTSISGVGPNEVWIAGNGVVLRCIGNTCMTISLNTPEKMRSIWAIDSQNAWVVGSNGAILRCSESKCNPISSGVEVTLNGVFVDDANTIHAVGDLGTILNCDSSGCSSATLPSGLPLNGVFGKGNGDFWIIGNEGKLMRCFNNNCKPIDSGTQENLNGIWGMTASEVWVAGDNGTLLRCQEAGCLRLDSGTRGTISSVSGSDADNIWICEKNGAIKKWNGNLWNTVSIMKNTEFTWYYQPTSNSNRLYDVWGTDTFNVWAVGQQGVILNANYDPPIRTYTDPRMETSCQLLARPNQVMSTFRSQRETLGTFSQVMSDLGARLATCACRQTCKLPKGYRSTLRLLPSNNTLRFMV